LTQVMARTAAGADHTHIQQGDPNEQH